MKYYKERNSFILRTTLRKCLVGKMSLKSAPQKLNFIPAKAMSKIYTLHCSCKCSCMFSHSYT